MTTQHIETLIIRAGQAGLSTGYHLQRMNLPILIVDADERIGDNWRPRYDWLRLYTPAKYSGLPGMAFPAEDRWSYPHRDDVADFLERYAIGWGLPVQMSICVDRLAARPGGGYAAFIGNDTVTCDNVVVATGTSGPTPNVPDFATGLDPGIRQLHSSEYRRPEQLQPGTVLVVGASHSGTDIAYDTVLTHPTTLCGGDCGQIPGAVGLATHPHWVTRLLVFAWRRVVTRRTPIGRKTMPHIRFHGGPMLRVKREDPAARGVRRHTARVSGVTDGRPVLADGTVLDVRNVICCTGFKHVFDWIEVPIFGADGRPREYRSVCDEAPGLFFCGLSFQYVFSSMVFPGVGRDAEYIASKIAARMGTRTNAKERVSS